MCRGCRDLQPSPLQSLLSCESLESRINETANKRRCPTTQATPGSSRKSSRPICLANYLHALTYERGSGSRYTKRFAFHVELPEGPSGLQVHVSSFKHEARSNTVQHNRSTFLLVEFLAGIRSLSGPHSTNHATVHEPQERQGWSRNVESPGRLRESASVKCETLPDGESVSTVPSCFPLRMYQGGTLIWLERGNSRIPLSQTAFYSLNYSSGQGQHGENRQKKCISLRTFVDDCIFQ